MRSVHSIRLTVNGEARWCVTSDRTNVAQVPGSTIAVPVPRNAAVMLAVLVGGFAGDRGGFR